MINFVNKDENNLLTTNIPTIVKMFEFYKNNNDTQLNMAQIDNYMAQIDNNTQLKINQFDNNMFQNNNDIQLKMAQNNNDTQLKIAQNNNDAKIKMAQINYKKNLFNNCIKDNKGFDFCYNLFK